MESTDSEIRDSLREKLEKDGREVVYKELLMCDPKSAKRIHPNDTQRLLRALEVFKMTGIPWSEHVAQPPQKTPMPAVLKIGLTVERKVLYERINQRTEIMIGSGMLNEVQNLIDMGYDCNLKSMQSIGYRHICNYMNGKWTLDKTIELLARDTRHYAKRQLTWFKRDPSIQWFSPENDGKIFSVIEKALDKKNQ
jgi:tRNA dimethylallyltransferase